MSSPDALYATHPTPAGERSIRVFEIEAASNHDTHTTLSNVIRGRMKVINLDHRPTFSALSYVWGSYSTPPNEVLCDGNIINVTTNCLAALWQLRDNFGSLCIWIDAICINQKDNVEKQSQILLMQEIYTRADFVYVWLGHGNPRSDQAMDYLSTAGFQKLLAPYSSIHYRAPESSTICWKAAWIMTTKNLTHGLSLLKRGEHDIIKFIVAYGKACFTVPDSGIESETLEDFFSRDWANRVWTLQEIVLASNPVICCGNRVLSWRSIIYAVAYLEHSSQNLGIQIPEASIAVWKRMVLLWCYVNPLYSTQQTATDNITLRSFLPKYFDFLDQCVVRRRIVAFAAAIFTTALIAVFGSLIDFDETTPVAWLIIEFLPLVVIGSLMGFFGLWVWVDSIFRPIAVPLIFWKSTSSMLLDQISVQEAVVQELFSRNATNNKDKSFGLYSIFTRLGLTLNPPDYTKSLCQIYTELFGKILHWNQALDMLMHVSEFKEGYPSWLPDWTLDQRRSWFNPATKLKRDHTLYNATKTSQPAWTWKNEEELSLRGLIVSQVLECSDRFQFQLTGSSENTGWLVLFMRMERHQTSTFFHDLWQVWHFSQNGEPVLTGYPSIDGTNLEPLQKDIDLYSDGIDGSYRQHMFHDLRQKRRILFRTSIPNRMTVGNCPDHARVGDLIALVSGIPVPMVLRPEGVHYKLIGPAEVDGLMQGELWDDTVDSHLVDLTLI